MKIHIIGIGGMGISALAKLYVNEGHDVVGTNDQPSEHSLASLEDSGVKINYNLKDFTIDDDTDLIVYSNAWPKNYPDIIKAADQGLRSCHILRRLVRLLGGTKLLRLQVLMAKQLQQLCFCTY